MDRLKFLWGIIILLLLGSCGKYKDIEVGDLQDFSIRGFAENALILDIKVPVKNPSMHKITITDFDARIFIDEKYMGKVTSAEPVILKRKSDEMYDIVLHVRLANFFGSAMKMMNLKRGKQVNVRLEGSFVAKSMGLKRKMDINETRDVVL